MDIRVSIVRMILGERMLLTTLGVAIGLIGALALTRFLQSLRRGVARKLHPRLFSFEQSVLNSKH